MRIFKSHPLLKLVNSYVIDSPQPSNISYLWNFGSLLAFCLVIQIVTGVTLAMHYNPSVIEAFNSVEHIMRDVNNGWLIRYLHSNTASAFFFIVYLHIGRGLYYGSYKAPRTLVWTIGTIIFLLMIATAFLGYYNGPIWFKLNWKFLMHLTLLLSLVSFIIFYLDNFRLLSSYPIWYFQIFSFVNILFALIIMWGLPNYIDTICYAHDKGDVNLHGDASVGKEAATELAKGMHTIGGQLGLGASMAGVATKKIFFTGFQYSYWKKRYNSNLAFKHNNLLDEFLKEKSIEPVDLYENLHLDETRKAILQKTKNLAGVYLIFNKVTGDYYVGSAATNRFYSRFSNHLLYFRGSKILKHAVNKYNLSGFAFIILQLFNEEVNKENNKNLLNMEDFYLKYLLPNYNILTEAGSSFGYKHTELDRIKMKNNYSLERRVRIGNLNKNNKLPMEIKEKMSKKAYKSIILYNLNYTVFGEYNSIVEGAKSINCSEKTIRRALKTEKKIVKRRFIVKYNKQV